MDAVAISDGEMYLKAFFAFAFVVALMFGFSWVLKRLGLAAPGMASGAKRRLKVVEHLSLDGRRRLVLVRCDSREHLIVIGGPGGDLLVEADIPAPPEREAEAAGTPQQKDVRHAG